MVKKTFFFSLAAFLSFPLFASAQNIWKGAKCGGIAIVTGGPTGPCSFCDAVIVSSNIITYLTELAIVIAVAMIAYGAILMMISAGNQTKFADGRSTMTSAIIGLVVTLSAWLIVNTILHLLSGNSPIPWNQIQCK